MDFSFDYDESRVLLTVMQRGYWTIDVFRAFEREYLHWHARIRPRHRNYRVFAECAEFKVQSNDVGEAFGALFAKLMDENHGHYAIIAGTALNRIQAKRVIPQPNVGVFTDRDEAMAWLFEPGSLPDKEA